MIVQSNFQLIIKDNTISQLKASNNATTDYAVNHQLKPVEMGIRATNNRYCQESNGLVVFNHYFALLAPSKGLGYTLSDIWDGYFHVTVAKFFTYLVPPQLEEVRVRVG